MGLTRKMLSISTLGAVDFRSDKERTARNTAKTAKSAKVQARAAAVAARQAEIVARAQEATAAAAQRAADAAEAQTRLLQKELVKSDVTVEPARGPISTSGVVDLLLVNAGRMPFKVMAEIRAFTGGSLNETKHLVESVPQVFAHGIDIESADALRSRLQAAGASVDMILVPESGSDTPPTTPVEPAVPERDLAAQLADLAALRRAGDLSDEEFQAAKNQLLHRVDPADV